MSSSNVQATALAEQTVIFECVFHKPGIRRKGNLGEITTTADKDALGLSKQIIDSPEYKEICSIASGCRHYLRNLELNAPFKSGRHMLTLPLLEQAYERVEEAEGATKDAVAKFLEAYPAQKEAARDSLQGQYREEDYPSIEKLAAAFWVEKRVTTWSTPDASKIGEYLYQKESKRVAIELNAVADDAIAAMRIGIKELIAKLAAALGYKDNGHKRQVNPQTYAKVVEWIGLFDKKDILKDDELGKVVADMKAALEGKDIAELRSNLGLRNELKKSLDGAVSTLGDLIVNGPGRVVLFEDPEG